MPWHRFIRPGEVKTAFVLLLVLLFIAAFVSLIVGIELSPPNGSQVTGFDRRYVDAEAAAAGWPARTPHQTPWPDPAYWGRYSRPGVWQYHAQLADPDGGMHAFAMKLNQSGWPWPAVEVREDWWDPDDPALAGPQMGPDTHILWGGLLLDSVLLGGGLWFVLGLGFFAVVVAPRVAAELRARGHTAPFFAPAERRFFVMLLLIAMGVAAAFETNFAWAKYRLYRNDASKVEDRYWIHPLDVDPLPGWPVRPPAKWDHPNVWMANREFGVRNFHVQSQDDEQTRVFAMEVWNYGWPFTALQDLEFDWPGTGATSERLDPPLRPHLLGLGMNATFLGAGPFLVLAAPVLAIIAFRRIRGRLTDTDPIVHATQPSRLTIVRNRIALAMMLVAIAAALNVPLALALSEFYSGPRSLSSVGPFNKVQAQDAEAARYGWPSTFPPGDPWPAPDRYSRASRVGVTAFDVYGPPVPGGTRVFVMQIHQVGWPLRVIEDKSMGWDTAAPGMQRSDFRPAPTLLTRALLLNPLIVGGSAFLILFLPLTFSRAARARRWRRLARCPSCGYEIKNLPVCPECGRPQARDDRSRA